MKKVRKGFTVVELVIVIAVIAIIAAIMIPFLNNNNSTVSADTDTQLIRNLNAALAFDSAQLGDKKHTNMSQVLDVVEKSGYIVEDINESEETYEIIWDSSNDVFCYLIGDELAKDRSNVRYLENTIFVVEPKDVKDYEYWRIYNEDVPTVQYQTFSIYFGKYCTFEKDSNGFFVANVGVDTGNRYDIYGVKYENTKNTRDVVIKTNAGCLLTVYGYVAEDGSGDTISHYGESGKQIISCSMTSFLEYGASSETVIKRGHYVQEPGSIVSYINVSSELGDSNLEFCNDSITGTLINTNEINKVTITNEKNHLFINLELRESGGEICIDLKEAPLYSNTVDKDTINGKNNSVHIFGVGEKGVNKSICPSSLDHCYIEEQGIYVHDWIYLDQFSLRICRRCGGYEYSMDIEENKIPVHKTVEVNFGKYIGEDGSEDNVADGIRSFDSITTKEHIHVFGPWETLAEVSCISDGVRVRYCETCDASQTEIIHALGHEYKHGACIRCGKEEGTDHYHKYDIIPSECINPTCTTEGLQVEKCACGATRYTKIKALGHNYVNGVCTRCGDTQEITHNHNFVVDKDSVDATCVSDGLIIEKCSCGEVKRTIVKALGHNFVNGVCTRCGLLKEDEHTHDFIVDEAQSIKPTCTKEGLKVEKCICGAVKRTVIEPLGHTYENGICIRCGEPDETHVHTFDLELVDMYIAPTCTKDGLKVYKCSCGEITREVIKALGHDYNELDVCKRCGHVKDDHVHNFVKDEKESIDVSCVVDGLLVEKCSCGAERRTVIEHQGHEFVNGTCKYCGEKEPVEHKHENVYDKKQSIPATCVSDGLDVYVCECGKITRKPVAALGHDWNENGICRRCGEVNESMHTHKYVYNEELSVAPSCIRTGLKVEICECGKIKKTILGFGPHKYGENDVCTVCGHVNDEHVHTYELIYQQKTEATCTSAGIIVKKCKCGYVSYEVLPALGHNFVNGICTRCGAIDESHNVHEWVIDQLLTIPAKCLEDGVLVETCHCGAVRRTIIDRLGHEYDPETDLCIRCGELNPEHKHNYVYSKEDSIAPTCLEDGIIVKICRCGAISREIEKALGHNFVEGICSRCGETIEPYHIHSYYEDPSKSVAATCTEPGVIVKVCQCGETIRTIVNPLGHSYDPETDRCIRCGALKPGHIHKYVKDEENSIAPWCTTDGLLVEICRCGSTSIQVEKALGHSYGKDGKCIRCGKMHEHTYVEDKDQYVAPTCQKAGLKVEVCSCGDERKTPILPVDHQYDKVTDRCIWCGKLNPDHEHKYVKNDAKSVNPTCVDYGMLVEECRCGDVKQTLLDPLGHNFVEGVCTRCGEKESTHEHIFIEDKKQYIAPTCTSEGLIVLVCECGKVKMTTIASLGHEFDPETDRCIRCGLLNPNHKHAYVKDAEKSIDPWCTTNGILVEVCRCGAEKTSKVNALGHNYVNHICTRCGDDENEPDEPHTHSYVVNKQKSYDPSCTTPGLIVKECECGDVDYEIVDPLGHDYDETDHCKRCGILNPNHAHKYVKDEKLSIKPACLTDGLNVSVCRCGDIKREVVDALGHDYVDHICTRCGEKENLPHVHSYVEDKEKCVAPTCTQPGVKVEICSDPTCQKVRITEIKPLGHDYNPLTDRCNRCGELNPNHIHKYVKDEEKSIEPTKESYGVLVEVCRCGDEKRTIIPALDPEDHEHSYKEIKEEQVNPTCTVDGYKVFRCSCGDEYHEPIDALKHDYDKDTDRCKRCGELDPEHVHNYVKNKALSLDETCTNDGLLVEECRCGDVKRTIKDELGHNYVVDEEKSVNPKCIDKGLLVEYCTRCGSVKVTPIDALGHDFDPVTDICKRCGKLNPEHEHNYVKDPTQSIEPKCLVDGLLVEVCRCGDVKNTIQKALGHDYKDGVCTRCGDVQESGHTHLFVEDHSQTIAPTCTTEGLIVEVCECGAVNRIPVKPLGHDFDPTTDKCKRCGKLDPEHKHNYVEDKDLTIKATCVRDGILVEVCRCGDVKQTPIPALGHNYVEGVCTRCGEKQTTHEHSFVEDKDQYIAPTCQSEGLITSVCSCGKVKYTTVPKVGHKYDPETNRCIWCGKLNPEHTHKYVENKEKSIKATCLVDGLIVSECECGDVKYEVEKALGHNFVKGVCTRCGATEPSEPHEHNFVESIKDSIEPTCLKDGVKVEKCDCGAVRRTIVKALGHEYDPETDRCIRCGELNPEHKHVFVKDEEKSIAPWCEKDGVLVKVCRCGEETREVINALGHDFEDHICKRCGATENVPHVHKFVEDKDRYVAPTCTTKGIRVFVCECGDIDVVELNAYGHKYDPETDRCIRCGELNPEHKHVYVKDNERSVNPTCLKLGLLVEVCRCGDVKQTPIEALGHNYVEGVCTRCGETEPEVPHIHNYVEDKARSLAATCTQDGYKVLVCECGAEKVEKVDKLGHKYDETDHCIRCGKLNPEHKHVYAMDEKESFAETCTNPGLKVEKCCCGDTKRTVLNPLGHHYVLDEASSVKPTCTQAGLTVERCSCGAIKTSPISPLGHDYDETDHCKRCGELNPKHEHNYVKDPTQSIEPKCLVDGLLVEVCRCGDVKRTVQKALGHDFKDGVCTRCGTEHEHVFVEDKVQSIAPTCLDAGLLVEVCECGKIKKTPVSPLGHDYDPATDKCKRCGKLDPNHKHNYVLDEEKSIPSKCLEYGIDVEVCRCGDEKRTVVKPLGHDYGEDDRCHRIIDEQGHECMALRTDHVHEFFEVSEKSYKETCILPGLSYKLCKCGELQRTVVPALGHKYENGICVRCGKEEGVAHIHNYVYREDLSTPATCIVDGEKVYVCECREGIQSIKREIIKATGESGHKYNPITERCEYCGKLNPEHKCDGKLVEDLSKRLNPTCINEGYAYYTCSICGESIYKLLDIDTVNGHDYNEKDYCNLCGKARTNHKHNFVVEVIYKESCIKDGLKLTTCYCGYKEYEVIPAWGHTYDENNAYCKICGVLNPEHTHTFKETSRIDATCMNEGLITKECACGAKQYEIIPACGHKFNANDVCEYCGAPNEGHIHAYKNYQIVFEPSCISSGLERGTCQCGRNDYRSVDPLGHNFVNDYCTRCGLLDKDHICSFTQLIEIVEPTCQSPGYKKIKCEFCGNTRYESIDIDPNNHLYAKSTSFFFFNTSYVCVRCGAKKSEHTCDLVLVDTKEATCLSDGYMKYQCECGATEYKTISKLGHEFNPSDRKCSVCGKSESNYGSHVHKWTSQATLIKASCSQEGLTEYKCSCGATKYEKISQASHNFETLTSPKKYSSKTSKLYYSDNTEIKTNTKYKHCKTCGANFHYYSYKDCEHSSSKTITYKDYASSRTDKSFDKSCYKDGVTFKQCNDCGCKIVVIDHIDDSWAKNHENSKTIIDVEKSTDKCIRCDATRGGKQICSDKYHRFVDYPSESIEPNCICDGIKAEKCTVCGYIRYTKLDKESDAHHYDENDVCTICGMSTKKYDKSHKHSYKTTVLDVAATCVSNGIIVKKCSCGEKSVEIIPVNKDKHNYIGNVCTLCGHSTISHTHNFVLVSSAKSTCVSEGYEFYRCDCGEDKYVVLDIDTVYGHYIDSKTDKCKVCGKLNPTHKHYFTYDKTKSIAADCIHDGLNVSKCVSCGYVQYEIIPAKGNDGHKYNSDNVCTICGHVLDHECKFVSVPSKCIGATCINEGVLYEECATCGAVHITLNEKDTENGHKWNRNNVCELCGKKKYHICRNELIENILPTCISEGIKVYRCSSCGLEKFEIIPKDKVNGHKINKDDICELCGELNPKHRHLYTERLVTECVPATCTSAGLNVFRCSCGSIKKVVIEPLGHMFVNDVCARCGQIHEDHIHTHYYMVIQYIAPTCTCDGLKVEQCICGKTLTTILYALGHDFVEGECTRCHIKEVPHEHSYNELLKEVAESCTTDGLKVLKCSCGAVSTIIVKALGHDWIRKTYTAATCLETGSATYKCSRCDATRSDVLKSLGHDVSTDPIKVVKATCTKDGYEVYKCTRCTETFEKTLKANGHNLKYKIIEPSCTEAGMSITTCENCDYYQEEVLEPTGHFFGNWESLDSKYHTRKCKVCDFVEKEEHEMSNNECIHCGNKDFVCEVAGIKYHTLQEGFDASLNIYHQRNWKNFLKCGKLSTYDYEVVKLISDTYVSEDLTHPGGYGLSVFGSILDLNGYTVNLDEGVQLINEGNLVIRDSSSTHDGKIIGNVEDSAVIIQKINHSRMTYMSCGKDNYAKLIVKSGTIINDTNENLASSSSVIANTSGDNQIIIEGGTIISNNATMAINARYGHLTLTSGTIISNFYAAYASDCTVDKDSKIIFDCVSMKTDKNSQFKLYGGRYVNDPSDYLEEGYIAEKEDDGYYHISKEQEQSFGVLVVVKYRGWFFNIHHSKSFYSFEEAILFIHSTDGDDFEIELKRNAHIGVINIKKAIKINLNGFKITSSVASALFELTYGYDKGVSLMIRNGFISCPYGYLLAYKGVKGLKDGDVTFDGCNIQTDTAAQNIKGCKGKHLVNFIGGSIYKGSCARIGSDIYLKANGAYFSVDPQEYLDGYKAYQYFGNKTSINVGGHCIKSGKYLNDKAAFFIQMMK